MPLLHLHLCFTSVLCWLAHESSSLVLPNATELLSPPSSTRMGPAPGAGMPRSRRRRYLSPRDMNAILDYHNQVRAQVSPPAANMEYMMVWASSNRLGCALQACSNVQVWGSTWRRAVLLVCNYAIKGNWIGEAPYKIGRPCSACPPAYGGVCSNNMCFTGLKSNQVSWF
ncbi:UNVERIFIED_CONTAM: hypothetical protein H355_008871 [Colinus virginianus]|nr:hypothetical protein H355_008871 [Colinus virginianus]